MKRKRREGTRRPSWLHGFRRGSRVRIVHGMAVWVVDGYEWHEEVGRPHVPDPDVAIELRCGEYRQTVAARMLVNVDGSDPGANVVLRPRRPTSKRSSQASWSP